MNPDFNGPGGGGFGPNGGQFPGGNGNGAPVVHRMLTGDHVIAGIVFLVLAVVVVTVVCFLLYRLLRHSGGGWGGHSAAIQELGMRYARGEIGRDEFLQRRADLMSPAPPANLPPPTPPAGTPPPARPSGRGTKPAT
jgi:uncharacterized membrane protein